MSRSYLLPSEASADHPTCPHVPFGRSRPGDWPATDVGLVSPKCRPAAARHAPVRGPRCSGEGSTIRDMLQDVRQYIDRLQIESFDGYSIGEDHDDDPVLIDPAGRAVDTWRE